MATTPPFLVRASWRSSPTATGQVTGPVDVQFHVPPYSLEDVCTPVGMKTLFPIFENSCFVTRVSCEYIPICGACQLLFLPNKQAVVFSSLYFSTQQTLTTEFS